MDTDLTPGNFHISGAKIYIDNENIGSLNEEGAMVNFKPDVFLHKSAKYGSTPVAGTVIGVEITAELHIGETTQANLLRILAGAEEAGGTVTVGGVVGEQLTTVDLLIVPFDDTDSIHIPYALKTSNVEIGYGPTKKREYVVTFTGVADATTGVVAEVGQDVS